MPVFDETVTWHVIRPEDLNHHGTLFAGKMSMWVVEAGLIAASRLVSRPEDIVCVQIDGMTFKKSVNNGDLLSIRSRVAYLGQKSITIHSQVYHGQEEAPLVSSMTTFVKVDKDNKPLPHGFTLPADYIAQNKTIYDEAIRMRQSLRERK